MWAHWGPQCVPEQGDWYARQMYQEGNRDYIAHVARYGHPSKVGFKDVIHQWNAEDVASRRAVALYKQAGAQYFMALANHHDNFDNWDSKHQPWNSVRLGPKKDLIGGWAKATRRAGMKFGVSVHASRAWSWYEVAQGADKDGPFAGVPYDGKLTRAQGEGAVVGRARSAGPLRAAPHARQAARVGLGREQGEQHPRPRVLRALHGAHDRPDRSATSPT